MLIPLNLGAIGTYVHMGIKICWVFNFKGFVGDFLTMKIDTMKILTVYAQHVYLMHVNMHK